MKLVPIGFASIIVVLAGVSAGFAQDRYRGTSDQSQNGVGANDREQAGDERSDRDIDRRGRRRSFNEIRQGENDNLQSVEGQTAQASAGQVARFRFVQGNARFDIRCPANGQMRECLEAASQFIRLMNQVPETTEKGAETGSAPK